MTKPKMSEPQQRLLVGAVAGLVLAMCFAGSFLAAFHQPSPHRLPVAVVAPSPEVGQLEAGLGAHLPGAFRLEPYRTQAAARAAVADRTVDGALIVTTHVPQLLVASAAGMAPAQTLTQAFTKLTASGRQHLQMTDVVPLPANNREGLSVFFLVVSVLLPSLIVGATSSLIAREAPAALQTAVLVAFAVLIGAATVWIADGLTGALPGHYLALAGTAALLSLAISGPTAALARIAAPGAALAILTFLIVGVPATGGPVGLAQFLPGFFRVFNPALPPSVTVPALTNIAYFHAHAIAPDLLVLAAWAVAGLLALLTTSRLKTRHPQATASHNRQPSLAG